MSITIVTFVMLHLFTIDKHLITYMYCMKCIIVIHPIEGRHVWGCNENRKKRFNFHWTIYPNGEIG